MIQADTAATVASNDDWANATGSERAGPADADLFTRRGAFALSPTDADAAIAVHSLINGPHTIVTREKLERPGIVLNEIYSPESAATRLTNLSARPPPPLRACLRPRPRDQYDRFASSEY